MSHWLFSFSVLMIGSSLMNVALAEEFLQLNLQFQTQQTQADDYLLEHRQERWKATETAIIVCDVWDYHHCYNAVKRLEQFAPRLNQVVKVARQLGCTIIHSPSDCMDAYAAHPARVRAMSVPVASPLPHAINDWCSQIPSEEMVIYPIDQSDGGEDDNPEDHAKWASKLEKLGRNPKMPWKKQLATIEMEPSLDYISDRGEEVWSILEAKGIRNVILTGVHVNMCVLGRPFGLRQLARNGKNVVLMRDMTDSMYNPQRWPYVSHHEGTRRIISHIERHVCSTVTSDQLLGGDSFRWTDEKTTDGHHPSSSESSNFKRGDDPRENWVRLRIQDTVPTVNELQLASDELSWFRRVVKLSDAQSKHHVYLKKSNDLKVDLWLDGVALKNSSATLGLATFEIPSNVIESNDYHLLAVRCDRGVLNEVPQLSINGESHNLDGQWEYRVTAARDASFARIPLPAKFGGAADVVYESSVADWTPRVVTRSFEFTSGIEGPACDSDGIIYAVNYCDEGTIGMVSPSGKSRVFINLPEGSVGNGIRFNKTGQMFVADYKKHQILRVSPKTREVSVYAMDNTMSQPNDLAVASDGMTLYASDPNWKEGDGRIWKISPKGECVCLVEGLGTTNGIEISPDGGTLYVNETRQRKIWSYRINGNGDLTDKKCFHAFSDFGLDGMRCDVDGNLYVTRHGKGTVVKLNPQGVTVKEVSVLGRYPTNLCFGGPDRRTLYVTEAEYQRLVAVRVDRPGRE